jgi:hypothetical protein
MTLKNYLKKSKTILRENETLQPAMIENFFLGIWFKLVNWWCFIDIWEGLRLVVNTVMWITNEWLLLLCMEIKTIEEIVLNCVYC